MKFRCRTTIPEVSAWREVKGENLIEAVQTFHADGTPQGIPSLVYRRELESSGHENVYFSLIEIEGHGELVGRTFHRGIWRKGGVKRPILRENTLEGIAEILGWTHPVEELLGRWEGEHDAWI